MLAWAGTAHAVANARQRHKLYREHALSPATARQVKRYNGTVAALLLTCVADVLANGGYIAAVLLGTRLFPALLLLLALPILVGGLGVGVKVSALRQRPGIYPGASTPNFRCALRLSDRGSVATPPG
jgi:hypothetical protein